MPISSTLTPLASEANEITGTAELILPIAAGAFCETALATTAVVPAAQSSAPITTAAALALLQNIIRMTPFAVNKLDDAETEVPASADEIVPARCNGAACNAIVDKACGKIV